RVRPDLLPKWCRPLRGTGRRDSEVGAGSGKIPRLLPPRRRTLGPRPWAVLGASGEPATLRLEPPARALLARVLSGVSADRDGSDERRLPVRLHLLHCLENARPASDAGIACGPSG